MKITARKIRKIKNKAKFFIVKESYSLFGYPYFEKEVVLAFNPEQAVNKMLKRRQRFSEMSRVLCKSSSEWGQFNVLPKDKPFERFATYWM